jgi:hypothetical protein
MANDLIISNMNTALTTVKPEYNVMDYITIASTGNATDFGDLPAASNMYQAGTSNAHGGL